MSAAGWYAAPDGSDAEWYFDGTGWRPESARPKPGSVPPVAPKVGPVVQPVQQKAKATPKPTAPRELPKAEPIEESKSVVKRIDGERSAAIESVLGQFGVKATMTNIVHGPSVVRYELKLGPGIKVEKVSGLHGNLQYETACESVRVLAPIPGKTAIGVELPRKVRQTVKLGDLPIEDDHPLVFPVGMNVDGEVISANLAEMPHILVSGTTGAGKSCFINAMLVSMINRAGPDRLKLSLIDPKMVELTPFDGIPHLLGPVVTDPEEAHSTLFWLTEEMDRRYQAMRSAKVRSIETLDMPYIVVVIDELADLMKSRMGSDIEETIVRLAQKARAAGIHLVLATQRPSVDVVTGLIKANVPSRLAFSMASGVDSRVVLDQNGAESLLGKGDGLFLPVGNRHPIRIQSPFVTDEEVDTAVQEVS